MTKRLLQASLGALALGLLLILPVAGHAQAVYGSINGSVVDSTGAAIPNATVTVTDVGKGTSVTVTSNGSGEYVAEHLLADVYNVRCEAQGFQSFQATNVQVFVDTSPKVTCTLPVGTKTETVTVSADTQPELKTDRADVSTVFDAKQVSDLPLFGGTRNFTSLQLLLPGAQILGWSHATDENPQASQQIQIDGQAFGGVAYELDGTDNQDPILGIIVINPPLDAMAEAKITTQNFDAEFGKAVSSVVVASTKSGSNSFHGSAFEYRNSTAQQATNPFTQTGSNRFVTPGLYNQFGGSVGGPILKDRFFFFGDYQGQRQKASSSALTTVPTQQVLDSCTGAPGYTGCDFSQYATGGQQGVIYMPNSSTPYPGNVIPLADVSPQAMAFFSQLNTYIKATYGGIGPGLDDNLKANGSGLFNADQFDVRLDGQVNAATHAFVRFSRFTDVLSGAQVFGPNLGGPGLGLGQPGYGGQSTGANDSTAAGADIAINPKLLTDFRLGYYRYNIIDQKNNQGVNYFSDTLLIPGENLGTGDTSGSGELTFSNVPTGGQQPLFGSGLGTSRCNCPLQEREDQYQVVNNWTKIVGNHSVKFGADLRYARNLRFPSDGDRVGNNQFSALQTRANSSGVDPSQSSGLSFASFALGLGSQFNRYVENTAIPNADNSKEFQKRTFFYAQDTWRVTPNLTLNYGLRYEIFFPEAVNAPGHGGLMNLQDGYIRVAGVGGIGTNMNWSPDWHAFSPRIGLAYQLNPKTVIRAGYGRSYDIGVFGSIFGHVVTQNLPILAKQQITAPSTYAAAFTLQAGPSGYDFPSDCSSTNTTNCIQSNGLLVNPGYNVQTNARPDPLRLPTLDAWNFSVQRSLTPTLSVTAAYVGNKGTHTLAEGDSNNTNPNEAGIFLPAAYSVNGQTLHYDPSVAGSGISGNNGTSNTILLQRYYGGTLAACQDPTYTTPAGVPPGACGWTAGIPYYADALDTHFNALQVTITKQLTHGLSFTSNYQWARAFDFNSGYSTWNKAIDYGRDPNVREQQETLYGTWQLPFGRGGMYYSNAPTWIDEVVGHWEMTGALNWAGGLPYTVGDNDINASVPGSAPNIAYSTTHQRAQVVSPSFKNGWLEFVDPGSKATGVPVYTNGFTQAPLDTLGNIGRNNYFGPNFFNTDMAVLKHFPIREAFEAQFRADFFNVFNHVNPNNPSNTNIFGGNGVANNYAPGGVPRYIAFTVRLQF